MFAHPTAGFPPTYFSQSVVAAAKATLEKKHSIAAASENAKSDRHEKTRDSSFRDSATATSNRSEKQSIAPVDEVEDVKDIKDVNYVLLKVQNDAQDKDISKARIEKVEDQTDSLATAFNITPSNVSYRPRIITGKKVNDESAKFAAKHLIPDAPISQNAIVFEQGKKPRMVKAYPNVIVL